MKNKFTIIKLAVSALIIVAAFVLMIHTNHIIPTNSIPIAKKTIILDAGHGFPDSGASAASGTAEKDINLNIAKKLEKILKKNDAKVIMTRSDDNSLSDSKTNNKRDDLNKRRNIRDNSKADIFVSIHMNHFDDPKYYGAQVFYSESTEENKKLAECIQENMVKLADPSNNRQVKSSNDIFVLKNAQIPSVLIECGFLSNPAEAEKLSDSKYQEKLAWAIYCGISDFFQINY